MGEAEARLEMKFSIEGRPYVAEIHDDSLVFTFDDRAATKNKKPKELRRVIAFKDVMQVRVLQEVMSKSEKSRSSSHSSSEKSPQSALIIEYVHKTGIVSAAKLTSLLTTHFNDNFRWQPARIVAECSADNFAQCETVANVINTHISEHESHRPKRLLIFINPASGAKKSMGIYKNQISPLFHRANVKTDVVVTESPLHATETLQAYDLTSIDGIVSVGGDGTFTQVINALVARTAKDRGVDLNDIEADLGQLPLKIGIIPTGTGQGCIRMITGRYDPVTAALHIIVGGEMEVNLLSVHSDGQLVNYGCMMAAYGFFGETIKESESKRHLGRLRYPVCMMKTLTNFNRHAMELEIRNPENHEWQKLSGSYLCANVWAWDISCSLPKENLDPVERFIRVPQSWAMKFMYADLVDSSVGRFQWMKYGVKMMSGSLDRDSETLTYSKAFICDAFRVKASSTSAACSAAENIINIDGDPFELQNRTCEIRVRHRMLRVFGSGMDVEAIRAAFAKKT